MTHQIDLFKYMHEGAVIITPNNRLSAHLIQNYDEQYRKTQSGPLVKPLCFSYESWLHFLFNELCQRHPQHSHPIILTEHQQHYLWHSILQEQQDISMSTDLLNLARDAWQRCIFWQIDANHPALQQTTYTRRFQKWYKAFQQELDVQHAITIEHIPEYFLNSNYSIPMPTMIWTCFDEFTPLQKNIQEKFALQECQQLFDDYQETTIHGAHFAAENQQAEFIQASMWATERLTQGDRSIAIIVPDLQKQIHSVRTLCTQHFTEDLYNISYGVPLADSPIINTALQWLALDLESVTAQEIRLLLYSPFIQGGHSEFAARCQILQDSPLMKAMHVSWTEFLAQIKTPAPDLHACLQSLQSYPKVDSPYAWTQHFKQRLHALGFPGETHIDSNLYQHLKRFYLLFDELMSLNTLSTEMTAHIAMQNLSEMAVSTLFQIQKRPTPISILGMLEASGCRYDSIWITGLTDQSLPQKTKFSPFLPIHLQKTLSMPHTDAHKEFKRAQQTLDRFGYATRSIVYSYPLTMVDQPQLPCTLIEHYPSFTAFPFFKTEQNCALEQYAEHYNHPPKLGEKFSGGTALLANQAKCPFQAFALHRLKIKENPNYSDGLDPAERGQILHSSLEMLWSKLANQANLLRLTTEQLEDLILRSIDDTLQLFGNRLPALAQELESYRLLRLIQACLLWEQQREPFQISALEASYQITLAGLPLNIRVDRLDQCLAQPSKIIIDYKTSLPTSKPWLEERPEAPQLLLYALLDKQIDTLIFMQMKAGRMTLQGLSARPQETTGIQSLKENESWSTYQQHWEQQLTLLAEEIQQGYCEPKPKRASLCQQCSVQSLCRVSL